MNLSASLSIGGFNFSASLGKKSLAEQEAEIHRMELGAARRSSAALARYVMRDEKGQPFKQAPFHREWHQLLSLSSLAFQRQHGYLPTQLQPGDRLIIEGAAELGKSLQLLAYCAFLIGQTTTILELAHMTRAIAREVMCADIPVLLPDGTGSPCVPPAHGSPPFWRYSVERL
jgi:hypothetical protein